MASTSFPFPLLFIMIFLAVPVWASQSTAFGKTKQLSFARVVVLVLWKRVCLRWSAKKGLDKGGFRHCQRRRRSTSCQTVTVRGEETRNDDIINDLSSIPADRRTGETWEYQTLIKPGFALGSSCLMPQESGGSVFYSRCHNKAGWPERLSFGFRLEITHSN